LRRYFILTTKKCRIYAAFGVSQTPKYKFLMKGGVKMLEHKENKELTEAEVNAYDLVIICYGKLRKDCLTDCLDGTYWLSPEQ